MKYVLVLIVLPMAAFLFWRHVRRSVLRGAARARANRKTAQTMVPCALCGVHIAQHEAFYRAGRPYCSVLHARNAQQETAASTPCVDSQGQHQP